MEDEQTTKCQKKEVQKEKQRSTKHYTKTKDRSTRKPLKIGMNPCAPEG
jgi:hypothetical protein